MKRVSKEDRVHKLVLWLLFLPLFVLLAIELLSLAQWISYPFYQPTSYEDSSWWAIHLETKLFYLPAGLAPLIFVVMIFSWVVIPLGRYLGPMRVRVKIWRRMLTLSGERKPSFERPAKPEMFRRRFPALALACSIGLASLFAIYPYLPSVNPDGRHVGIDLPHYEQWLGRMDEGDWLNAVSYAFSTLRERPLSVLLIFGAHKITGFSSLTVLKFMPLLLGPLLILVMFYFVLEATGDWTVSSLVALLAAFSYPVTVGMLGGLFSNWIGLIEVYLFSGLMMRSMRMRSWRWGFLAALTMVSVLFTHAYTWGLLIGVLGLYVLLLVVLGMRGENVWWEFKVVGAIITGNVVVVVLGNWLLGSIGVARAALGVAMSGLALEFLGQFWSGLNWTLQNTMGGFYMNPVVLFLALLGAFFVCLRDKTVHRYLALWLMLSSVLFVLGNRTVQWRILYDLPITIFAAFGLNYVRRWLRSLGSHEAKILESLCILLVVLVNANYGFRCAYNLTEIFSVGGG